MLVNCSEWIRVWEFIRRTSTSVECYNAVVQRETQESYQVISQVINLLGNRIRIEWTVLSWWIGQMSAISHSDLFLNKECGFFAYNVRSYCVGLIITDSQ